MIFGAVSVTSPQQKMEEVVASEAIGLLGAVMIVGSIAYVWLGRLKDKAPAGDFNDTSAPDARPERKSHYHLKLGMPESQARPDLVEPTQHVENKRTGKAHSKSNVPKEVVAPAICPTAAANLDIAAKLAKMGDLEGVLEFAHMVLESDDATEQQKIQARTLKRQCSPR
ncbi:hypothetical protein A1D17_04475 [Pseudomonas fluorescens]|uniref:Transmembrane protein n=2 Tax=Pseudomonas TaxID=286 RepID=A0A161ZG08_PSEFL|nr:hypothetical protein A1D17_04475 [Pseudomonas fluorescens]